jgi:hypothetical protein
VDYFLLPLTTTLPTQLTPNAANTGSSQIPSLITGKQGTVLRFLETNYKSSWHGIEQELESSSKQARRWPLLPLLLSLSLSLCATKQVRDLYSEHKRRRGWTVEDDRAGRQAGRHVTARSQFLVFVFVFFLLAQKTLFLFFSFFSLNKGKQNQAPYESILTRAW